MILSIDRKVTSAVLECKIRFWEKSFKLIKPKVFNSNRRYYDMSEFYKDIGEVPSTSLLEGVKKTVDWYKSEY